MLPRHRRAAGRRRATTSTGTTPCGSSCPTTTRRGSTTGRPIDLRPEFDRRGVDLFALPEGNATVVCGDGAHDARRWLTEVDGVEGTAPFHGRRSRARVLPGVVGARAAPSGSPRWAPSVGTHGGPRTRSQVAVVTGGHPAVGPLAAALADAPDHGRRLGPDRRRPPRPRPARRDRSFAGLTASRASRAVEWVRHVAPRSTPDAGDDRRATRRARVTVLAPDLGRVVGAAEHDQVVAVGRRSNAGTSSVVHHAALELQGDLAAGGEHRGVSRDRWRAGSAWRRRDRRPARRTRAPSRSDPRARVRRRHGRRRAAASTRPAVRSSQPRSCTNPATCSSTSVGARRCAGAPAHCKAVLEDREATFVVGVARRRQRVEQRVDVGEAGAHNDGRQHAAARAPPARPG